MTQVEGDQLLMDPQVVQALQAVVVQEDRVQVAEWLQVAHRCESVVLQMQGFV